MNSIADALVYSVAYLNCREDEDEDSLDDDVAALESIAACLAAATDAEKDALAAAAKRALAEEQSATSPRENYVRDYENWMEEMFGDEWVGNDRARP